jgi:hypothetical protein
VLLEDGNGSGDILFGKPLHECLVGLVLLAAVVDLELQKRACLLNSHLEEVDFGRQYCDLVRILCSVNVADRDMLPV